MCQKLQFFFHEWDEETREAFIESLAQMTADYIKSKQDYERKKCTEHERGSMADLDD